MRLNSTIRNVRFAQGVEITGAFTHLEDTKEIALENNSPPIDTGIGLDPSVGAGLETDIIVRRYTSTQGEMLENITYRIAHMPNVSPQWILAQKYKSDEGKSTGVSFTLAFDGDKVLLMASSSSLDGDDHTCKIYLSSKVFLKN